MKKYKTILADPPWKYRNTGVDGACEKHYNTMSIEELCAMPIRDISAKDSVLIMWCTWPQLREGVELMAAWGFEYKSGFPWIKIRDIQRDLFTAEYVFKAKSGVGFWVLGCSEFIIIGKRGNAKPPEEKMIGLLSPNSYHSRKPDDIYEYAESFPGPYLELFARRERGGWDVFGNEVESSIELGSPHNNGVKPTFKGAGENCLLN